MKQPYWIQLITLTAISLFSFGAYSPTTASTFQSKEVEQSRFIAVATPLNNERYILLILEQLSAKKACWSESGTKPVTVEPLLLKFDFTGICGRSTDSNGYSIRLHGEDLGWRYLLHLVKRNNELVLMGTPAVGNAPAVEIGKTQGIGHGIEKIVLNPGWRFTKRTFNGKTLAHIYLTSDRIQSKKPGNNTSVPLLAIVTQKKVVQPKLLIVPGNKLVFTKVRQAHRLTKRVASIPSTVYFRQKW